MLLEYHCIQMNLASDYKKRKAVLISACDLRIPPFQKSGPPATQREPQIAGIHSLTTPINLGTTSAIKDALTKLK
jgi:hypothetical protein